jgi:hypothetical protein
MAEAVLTLSHRANADHTTDDFTVGRRVKAHPATDTFMRGDVYGTIEKWAAGPDVTCRKPTRRPGRPPLWRSARRCSCQGTRLVTPRRAWHRSQYIF